MISYAGNTLYPFSFGLYDIDCDFEASKERIETEFKALYEDKIKEVLKKNGLKYMGMDYFSPNAYNYANDSLDLNLEVVNKDKLKEWVLAHAVEINARLKANKSYDGCIAATPNSLSDEDLSSPSIVVLGVMLEAIDFKEWETTDYIIGDEE